MNIKVTYSDVWLNVHLFSKPFLTSRISLLLSASAPIHEISTEEYLAQQGLNEQQVKAVIYVKKHGRITNQEFIALIPQKVTTKTASRNLKRLCDIGILTQIGISGKGTYYILSSPRVVSKKT